MALSQSFLKYGKPFTSSKALQESITSTSPQGHVELPYWHLVVYPLNYWVKSLDPTVVGERFNRVLLLLWFRSSAPDSPTSEWSLFRHQQHNPTGRGAVGKGGVMGMAGGAGGSGGGEENLGLVDGVKKEVVTLVELVPSGAKPLSVQLHYLPFHFNWERTQVRSDALPEKEEAIRVHSMKCCLIACGKLLDAPETSAVVLGAGVHPLLQVLDLAEEVRQWMVTDGGATTMVKADRPALANLFAQVQKEDEKAGDGGASEGLEQVLVKSTFFNHVVTEAEVRAATTLTTTTKEEKALKQTKWTSFRLTDQAALVNADWKCGIVEEVVGHTPVLHLFKDAGDACWIEEKLTAWNAPCEQFNDYLGDEGSLRFKIRLPVPPKRGALSQPGDSDPAGNSGPPLIPTPSAVAALEDPFEGVPMQDIDFFSLRTTVEGEALGAIPELAWLSPVAGETYKPTPMDHAQRVIRHHPATAQQLREVALVVKVLEENGLRAQAEGSEPSPVLSVPIQRMPSTRCCQWCSRPREKPSRCSACKVVSYCCADHQKQDWKGHKKLCKDLKQFGAEMAEAQRARQEAGSDQLLSVGGSNYGALVEGIQRAVQASKPLPKPEGRCNIHVVDIEDPEELLEAVKSSGAKLLDACAGTAPGSPYLTIVAESVPEQLHNSVFVLRRAQRGSGGVEWEAVPKSGVIGDWWHQKNIDGTSKKKKEDEENNAVTHIRLVQSKYNHFYESLSDLPQEQPSMYLSLGSRKTDGLNFFHASTHLLVQTLRGKVPIFFFLVSRLAAEKTQDAFLDPLLEEKANTAKCDSQDPVQRDPVSCLGPAVVVDYTRENCTEIGMFLNAFVLALVPV